MLFGIATLALGNVSADSLISDRVVVLEADGRTHTVQHTLLSDGPLATLRLPGSVIPQRVEFGGPERVTFRHAWHNRPERLSLWSGSAFARYRHQYGDEVRPLANGGWRLKVASVPSGLSIESAADFAGAETGPANAGRGPGSAPHIDIASTWVFPSDVDVLDWQADAAGQGAWTFEDNSLAWQQAGSEPVMLTITYRTRGATAPLANSLSPPVEAVADAPALVSEEDAPGRGAPESIEERIALGTDDAKASGRTSPVAQGSKADEDDDGVLDNGDICLGQVRPAWTATSATAEPAGKPAPELGAGPVTDRAAAKTQPLPGCGAQPRVVLEGIGFAIGQSRLDAAARRVLDRVAHALGTLPGQAYEIAAHTDNQGKWTNNLALSARRARAVRQYLLLRGVSAERLSATGHGESRPLADNGSAEGRRRNRRIELGPLPPGAPEDPPVR